MARKPKSNPEQRAPRGKLPPSWRKGIIWRDPAYTDVLSCAEAALELVKLFKGEPWTENIESIDYRPTRLIGDSLEQRQADLMFRIRYKPPPNGGKRPPDTYVVVEFQSKVERYMAVRILGFLGLAYRDVIRQERPEADEQLPPFVLIVIYTGKRRWRAKTELNDLIHDNGSSCLPLLRYELLEAWWEGPRTGGRNLISLLFQLERGETPKILLESTKVLRRRVDELGSEALENSVTMWLRALFGERLPGEDWREDRDMHEMEQRLATISKDWTDQWQANARKEGRKEGLEKGLAQGRRRMLAEQRSTLRAQVQRRFGRAVATAFAHAIKPIESPAKLVEIAMRVAQSDNGDELLESVQGI